MIYQVKLPAEAFELVLQSLAAQPYGRVAKVIAEITGQLDLQNASPVKNTATAKEEETGSHGNGA